jgi:hypothetical protein
MDPRIEGDSWDEDPLQTNIRRTCSHSCVQRRRRFHALSVLLFTSSTNISVGSAFLGCLSTSATFTRESHKDTLLLRTVPLSRFSSDLTFFSEAPSYRLSFDEKGIFSDGEDKFELSIVQEEDLPDLSRFVVAAFGADVIRLSQDVNAFERMLLSPATELLNGYSNLVAFAEVFQGTRQRLASRFEKMDLSVPNVKGLSGKDAITVAEKDSLVLVVARPSEDKDAPTEIIASIELRLQVRRIITQFEFIR